MQILSTLTVRAAHRNTATAPPKKGDSTGNQQSPSSPMFVDRGADLLSHLLYHHPDIP